MNLFSADIVDRFVVLLYPLFRVAAMMMSAPFFSLEAANARIRIGLAVALVLLIQSRFSWPSVAPFSEAGLMSLFNEIAIGLFTGMSLQIVSSAVVLAGQFISGAMGLSLANLIDPNLGNVPVISQVLLVFGTLLFLAMGGHIILIELIVESFRHLPVGSPRVGLDTILELLRWSSMVFLGGLMLALPVMAALLVANLGLGVMTRAAPSLNVFVVGVPVTIALGLFVLLVTTGATASRMHWLWLRGFDTVRRLLGAG